MNESEVTGVNCGLCGITLAEPSNTPTDKRSPCPKCGSTARLFSVTMTCNVTVNSYVMLSGKRFGKGREGKRKVATVEFKSGDSLHRDSGRWMKLEQTVDREANRYRKVVIDPDTGRVLRSVDKPLDEHRGHGSAKRKGRPGVPSKKRRYFLLYLRDDDAKTFNVIGPISDDTPYNARTVEFQRRGRKVGIFTTNPETDRAKVPSPASKIAEGLYDYKPDPNLRW